jgi:hypothetical protein
VKRRKAKEPTVKYPMEMRERIYRVMDKLKNKKTAAEIRAYAVKIAIVFEEELPLQMLRKLSLEYRPILLSKLTSKWEQPVIEIFSIVKDCLKHY